MKTCKHKAGVTLVEILIVVAIIAIMASVVIGIATRIDSQAKEQLAEGTIVILTAALEQFDDFGYQYKHQDYLAFDFPLDCNDFLQPNLEAALRDALGATNALIASGTHVPNYSGSEALYFFLSRVPECRKTLERIDGSLITNKDSNRQDMNITIVFLGSTKVYPLLRIIDPWGETLRYDYYYEDVFPLPPDPRTRRNFPVITSAGPDRKFNTADDISNRN